MAWTNEGDLISKINLIGSAEIFGLLTRTIDEKYVEETVITKQWKFAIDFDWIGLNLIGKCRNASLLPMR